MACIGLIACKTNGVWMILLMPSAANVRNQKIMIGPKKVPPMRCVPWRCTIKSPQIITTVMGMTYASNRGVMILMPSTADNTEIAGVINESP